MLASVPQEHEVGLWSSVGASFGASEWRPCGIIFSSDLLLGRYMQERRGRVRERQAELLRERSPPLAAIEDGVSALHQFLVGSVGHRVCRVLMMMPPS